MKIVLKEIKLFEYFCNKLYAYEIICGSLDILVLFSIKEVNIAESFQINISINTHLFAINITIHHLLFIFNNDKIIP
jgi:hypothetical protein